MPLKDEACLKHIERLSKTAGSEYCLVCDECLKVSPNNRPGKQSA